MTECSWALLNIVGPDAILDSPTVPLGTPLEGVRVTLRTAFGIQSMVNGNGTICIESPAVALGYHARPEETASAFPRPNTYVTTDLGRLRPDGQIEFAGRLAHHVKLRGFRIDLREIEACLATHPDVREAATRVHDGPRGPELVGYVVARDGQPAPDAAALRDHLAAQLPDYMVPVAILSLPALPRGATGKLDRNALPAPGEDAFVRRAFVAPRTQTEQQLAAMWSALLGVEKVGIHDDFFELGGHSLLTIRLVSEIDRTLGVRVPVRKILEQSTIEALSEYVDHAAVHRIEIEVAHRIAYEHTGVTEARASSAQEYFWGLDRDDHDPASYCAPRITMIHGPLDAALFARSFEEIVAHHSIYRTAYRQDGGLLQQLVRPVSDVKLELSDCSRTGAEQWPDEIKDATSALIANGYDLEAGEGLIRARLLRLASDRHALVQTTHHIAFDGHSIGVFGRQLFQGYARLREGASSALTHRPLQYIDYVDARERWLQSPAGQANEAFWKDYVRGADPVVIDGDFPRANIDAHRDATFRGLTADLSHPYEALSLPDNVYAGVSQAAREARTTRYVVFMTALAWLLRERSGQNAVAIQSTYSPRGEDPALAEINGCLTTWTLNRFDFEGASSFADALRMSKQAMAEVQDHGAPADYYGIVPHRLRRVVVNYFPSNPGTADAGPVTYAGVRPEAYPAPRPTWKRTWDLHFTMMDNGSHAQLLWTGFSQLFRRETVCSLLDRYVAILAQIARQSSLR
jgi:acyl carrier protein